MAPPGEDRTASSQAGEEEPQQSAVYRKYIALQALAEARFAGWLAGRLVLCREFDLPGTELALCSVIAGAGFLAIDPRPQSLKLAVRNGSCNFMVNTLDEALRVLKNELRKRKALSVGLLGDTAGILPAMVERGVQPDLLGNFPPPGEPGDSAEALLQFVKRGALAINFNVRKAQSASEPIEMTWTAANPRDLEKIDLRAMTWLPADDTVRRRWLQEAPAYFYRQRPWRRVLGLREGELTGFVEALSGTDVRRSLAEPVELRWLRTRDDPQAAGLQTAVLEPLPGEPASR